MSDLRHRSPEELRKLIKWCEDKKAENEANRKIFEAEANRYQELADGLGRTNYNIGQKEVWARIYLAQKT